MNQQDPEDQFIRALVLIASTAFAFGLIVVATLVTVLVSANFNVLEWME
jgi:hypothetical protein